MKKTVINTDGVRLCVIETNTVVVGSGAAGYNAADRLVQYGQHDVIIVTDDEMNGTSRNAGSDKQTYYKLTQAGGALDSVEQMAAALMKGGCMDGDIALCEAALSSQCFYRLVELGVEFPCSRYGEYVGYKTDHDLCSRGISIGPYTSRQMTESLQREAREKKIPVLSGLQCIRVLSEGGECRGILCFDRSAACFDDAFTLISAENVIFATGGPAGMYLDSSYPHGQVGATGLALEAGVAGKNLTEWQFGLASIEPRWNVSGTYMQVVPRFVSTNEDGSDEREFLWDYLDETKLWEYVFLKGYQWPFDVNKILVGSSIIDILVYIENKLKNRRVFLDFRDNPHGRIPDADELPECCQEYLESVGALFGTPIERLRHMNQPAVDFYLEHGVDLASEPLEIALCAQHNNGGLAADVWWQTNLKGFFAVGEVCGSHGVYRPGGSALNAGQVGSMRAAQYISAHRTAEPESGAALLKRCGGQITELIELGRGCLGRRDTVDSMEHAAMERMSRSASIVRDAGALAQCLKETWDELSRFGAAAETENVSGLGRLYQLRDMLLCQYVYIFAMADYAENAGKSRGSALYIDSGEEKPYEFLPEIFRYALDMGENDGRIQEIYYDSGKLRSKWRAVRPMPEKAAAFEVVWKAYRENKNIY